MVVLHTQYVPFHFRRELVYRREELPAIRGWLAREYRRAVKGVSFLLHSDHGFAQAPFEEISRERFEQLAARFRPIDGSDVANDDGAEDDGDDAPDASLECAGGACPVR